jgi:drug/metabolite transporter (DMT)-like permease
MKEFTDFFLRNWILIVVFGNFLGALSNVVSKIIVSGSATRKPIQPTPITFYSGFFGIVVFLPALILSAWLGFINMSVLSAATGLIGGTLLILSLWPFYYVLSRNETSRVMTVYVGAVPFITFFLKYLFTGERLNNFQLLAVVFLVIGGILVSMRKYEDGGLGLRDLALVALAASGIASGLVFAEWAFRLQGFISGFIWLTGGYFLSSIILYLWPGQKEKILNTGEYAGKKNVFLFFSEKILGTSGSIMIKYAISLMSATLVNSFEGLKQFFVLILAGFLSLFFPNVYKEELKGVVLWQKITAAVLVFAGIFLLIYNNGK